MVAVPDAVIDDVAGDQHVIGAIAHEHEPPVGLFVDERGKQRVRHVGRARHDELHIPAPARESGGAPA